MKGKWKKRWKKIVLIALITVVCTFVFAWDAIMTAWFGGLRDQLNCYELSGNKLPELYENETKLGSGIYFHETSCPKDISDIKLSARQSCSIESALRAHFDTDVFLLISSPIFTTLEETENVFVRQLLTYPNFKVRHITVSKYLSSTPLNLTYKLGLLNYSLWPMQHASDVMRYATLYKFGGVYLDLDVLVLKPLVQLKNFVGAESNESLGSGILGFSFDKVGREVAVQCAKELRNTYNPGIWGFNGPGVITRIMERRCKTTVISEMTKSYCGGFRVYPQEYFQAISFDELDLLFQEGHSEKTAKLLNKSYTIHYWNKMSSSYVLDNRLDIPYLNYARKYCPRIYEAAGGNFN